MPGRDAPVFTVDPASAFGRKTVDELSYTSVFEGRLIVKFTKFGFKVFRNTYDPKAMTSPNSAAPNRFFPVDFSSAESPVMISTPDTMIMMTENTPMIPKMTLMMAFT